MIIVFSLIVVPICKYNNYIDTVLTINVSDRYAKKPYLHEIDYVMHVCKEIRVFKMFQ